MQYLIKQLLFVVLAQGKLISGSYSLHVTSIPVWSQFVRLRFAKPASIEIVPLGTES